MPKKRIELPNGCWVGKISIFPANWDKPGATTKKNWRIQYRFYDPLHLEKYPKGKLCVVKGMNHLGRLEDRRRETRAIIQAEIDILKNEGYHPIDKRVVIEKPVMEIEPDTPFIPALRKALELLKLAKCTMADIRNNLVYIEKSIRLCNYQDLTIGEVSRKHVTMILENCKRVKNYWSGHLFNHYRSYLQQLFTKCVQLEAMNYNPVDRYLPKEQTESVLRELLTHKERKLVDDHFRKTDRFFHRFMNIFFHSGARPVELLRLTSDKINLQEMYFKVRVRKRKKIVEEKRPIKLIALPFWEEVVKEIEEGALWIQKKPSQRKETGSDIYLFGKNLMPSRVPARRDYISHKWSREVKEGLGIDKDFYSLKHLNLDEVATELDLLAASRLAGHKSTVITMEHYTVGERDRANERIRNVANKFAG